MADKPGKDVLEDDGEERFEEITGATDDAGVNAAAADKDDGAGDLPDPSGEEDIEVVLADQAEEDALEADDKAKTDDAGEGQDDDALSAGGDEDADGAATELDAAELDELDDEDKTYSRQMQKRILREKAVTQRTREQAAQALAAERQNTIAAKREALDSQKALAEVVLINIAAEIDKAKADLRAAIEVQDTDKQTDAQTRLAELSAHKAGAEDSKKRIIASASAFEEEAKRAPAPQPQQQGEITPQTKAWIARNQWWENANFKAERVLTIGIDRQLAKEGRIAPNTEAYFRELDRRISREMPTLKAKVQQYVRKPANTRPNNGAPRASAAPGGRAAAGRPNGSAGGSKARVVLTSEDQQNMIRFKMDPQNKSDVLEYARNKRASEQGNRRA